jgi:hypothetical protein
MKRMIAAAGTILAMTAGIALAAGQGKGPASKIDLSTVRTVSGTVSAVSIGAGLKHPSFMLAEAGGEILSVELGPYWFLVANDFSLAVGDGVTATVANCANRSTSDVVALSVQNTTTGASITLRDEQGKPLWKGKRGRRGQGHGQTMKAGSSGAGCYASGQNVDLSSLQEVEGEVAALSVGLGTHRNSVTLAAQGGGEYVVSLGPFWYMQKLGFSLEKGETVRVRMARCTKGWVALSVEKSATGQALQLRNEQGVPLWIL